jgi:hypothetical protein
LSPVRRTSVRQPYLGWPSQATVGARRPPLVTLRQVTAAPPSQLGALALGHCHAASGHTERPRRLRARDIGRGASSLAYAAPISRSLATIQGNLTESRMMGGRSSGHLGEGRSRGQSLASIAERGFCIDRRLPHAARKLSWLQVRWPRISPLASHPGPRTARHALCCAASHSCIGPAPSSGLASADEPRVVCCFGPT